MRFFFIITVFLVSNLFYSQYSFSQNIVRQETFSQPEDSITIKNLLDMGKQHLDSAPGLAKKYFSEAEKISSKLGYRKYLAIAFYYQGIVNRDLGNTDSSFYFFNSSLFINRRINNEKGIIKCLIELALYNQKTEDYAEAIRNYFRSLDILTENPDIFTLGVVYHNLGSLYLELGKNKNALNYCLKAFKIEQQYNDSSHIGESLYNLGQIYYNLDSLNKSQLFFDKSLAFNTKSNNQLTIAETHLGIGRLMDKNRLFEKSTSKYQIAIDIFKKLDDNQKLAWAYYYYGCHLFLNNQTEEALETINKANNLNTNFPDLKLKREIYAELQEIYTDLKNYEKALHYSDLLKETEEKLKIPETLQYLAINEAELNFKLKEEKMRLEHEKALGRQKTMKLIFGGSSVFALVVILLILIVLRQKNKHNKILEKANDTRDKMFRLIAHDFRSPLISISNTVHLIPYKIKSKKYDTVINLCENVTHSVNRVLGLIDNLINWALSQHGNIPYNPENYNLNEISSNIIEIYKDVAQYKKIELSNEISEDIEIYADKNILNTVFRNLINNAIKFTPEGGKVHIGAKGKEGHVEIAVQDNGVGISQENLKKIFNVDKEKNEGTKGEKGNGLGLFFCKEFVHKNKGEIWVESEEGKGSKFYFTVPINTTN